MTIAGTFRCNLRILCSYSLLHPLTRPILLLRLLVSWTIGPKHARWVLEKRHSVLATPACIAVVYIACYRVSFYMLPFFIAVGSVGAGLVSWWYR
jgi:hypothetical protein